jgi:hypothetical protein
LLERFDPTGRLTRAVTANNFALPRQYISRLTKTGDNSLIGAIAKRLDIAAATPSYAGTTTTKAKRELKSAGVTTETREIAAEDEARISTAMLRDPLLKRGDRAMLYTRDGSVVAVVRSDQENEVVALRREVAELRDSMTKLGKARRGPNP